MISLAGLPAFPLTGHVHPENQGLTIREYYAGQALLGLLAGRQFTNNEQHPSKCPEMYAKWAREIADCMILEMAKDNAYEP